MKKQIKKLNLNKRTISNLGTPDMNKIVGGATNGNNCTQNSCIYTCKGNTCGGSQCNGISCHVRCDY